MKHVALSAAVLACVSFQPEVARAQADMLMMRLCKKITDDGARLKCFDEKVTETDKGLTAKPKAIKQTPQAETLLSPAMQELRARLDKAFLEAAINVQVMAISKRDQFTNGKLPQLMLFGYMNRASVYQIVTKTDLIRQAREAGFQSLDAFSKSDGHWIFDLSGSGQTCSRDLCF